MHTASIPDAFRAHFARHNRQVLVLTFFTLIAAILFWAVSFFIIYWLALIAVTSTGGVDARLPGSRVLPVFGGCALGLCAVAWAINKIHPDFFPRDKKPPLEIFLDFVLAAPRVTLAVWGNLSAWLSLSEDELEEAWELLRTVVRDRRVSVQGLPLEIPDPALRSRVIFALQLTGLVGLRRNEGGSWLVIEGERARLLARETVKIDTRQEN